MEPDAPTIIRFDDQVKGIVQVAKGVVEPGDQPLSPVTFHEFAGNVLNFSMASEDSPNAGHITLIRHQKGFFISFDFRYNSARIADHLEAAREFLDVAEMSLNDSKMRPFIADLYHAVELLAKASLLSIPMKGIVSSKSHGPIRSRYNLYSKGKAIEPRFAALFNRLDSLRNPARYPKETFKLEVIEAKEMLQIANEMYEALLSGPPFQLHQTAEKTDYPLPLPIDTPAE